MWTVYVKIVTFLCFGLEKIFQVKRGGLCPVRQVCTRYTEPSTQKLELKSSWSHDHPKRNSYPCVWSVIGLWVTQSQSVSEIRQRSGSTMSIKGFQHFVSSAQSAINALPTFGCSTSVSKSHLFFFICVRVLSHCSRWKVLRLGNFQWRSEALNRSSRLKFHESFFFFLWLL